jgi:nicotinamidase-related amidase
MIIMENAQSDFISVINSLLLIVDYQTAILGEIESGEQNEIKTAALATAKAASILNVPVVMTSRNESEYGRILSEIKDFFPGREVISRKDSAVNAFDDEKVLQQVRKHNRDKLIITGIPTSEGLTETASMAVREGYDVYVLIDACGDKSGERHNYGVQRMLKAGVTPITWMSLASEWMNGWADPVIGEMNQEAFGKYNVMLSYLSRH